MANTITERIRYGDNNSPSKRKLIYQSERASTAGSRIASMAGKRLFLPSDPDVRRGEMPVVDSDNEVSGMGWSLYKFGNDARSVATTIGDSNRLECQG